MSERVLNQAVYSLIKELEVETDKRVKEEARCKCKCKCKCGTRCEHEVRCERGAKCEHECEARPQSEICLVGCILFIPLLSVCTGDISTKAMVGADIVVRVL